MVLVNYSPNFVKEGNERSYGVNGPKVGVKTHERNRENDLLDVEGL